MRADLHLHTVYSDGCFTPDEVAARAKANGVELIAHFGKGVPRGRRCAPRRL